MKTNKLDLSKKYPDYFKKWVFRTAFIIILLLCVKVTVFEFNNNPHPFNYYYVICGEEEAFCVNPLYACKYPTQKDCLIINDLPQGVCEFGYCEKKYLAGGESYGVKPPFLLRYALDIVALILISSFIINHIIWRFKKNED